MRAGDQVRVRSLEEIRATLDEQGSLQGLPFMPEMIHYCGHHLRVRKRAHKTCDTLYGLGGLRVLVPAVHLDDVRCDGAAHGGCQASCLIFWHERWLEPIAATATQGEGARPPTELPLAWSRGPRDPARPEEEIYRCQATAAPQFTVTQSPYDLRQYAEDVTSGNVTIGDMLWGAYESLFRWLMHTGVGYRYVVALYDRIQRARGKPPNPYVAGTLTKTPVETLDLQVGERVRIRSFDSIMSTLDARNRNRGLWFVPEEMGRYCGRTAQVVKRVDRLIEEKSGRMIVTKTPSVVLDNIYCTGATVDKRLHCPRASALFWRELWLERVAPGE